MTEADLLIFDLDGTLIDSKLDIAHSVNVARESLGLEAFPLQKVIEAIGEGIHVLMQRVLEDGNEHLMEPALKEFRKHYADHLLDNTTMQAGVEEVLCHFQDKHRAVLTNKIESFTLPILEALGIKDAFEIVECGDNPEEKKPNPAGLNRILIHHQVKRERAVIIGDSPIDVKTGRAAGIKTCAILDGYATERDVRDSNPDFIIKSLSELKDILK